MNLQKYLVDFRILDAIDLPETNQGDYRQAIDSIVSYCELNNIDEIGYHFDHGEIDSPDDDVDTIAETQTFVTIRCIADSDAIHEAGDHDPAAKLYAVALKAIKDGPAHIANYWYREQGPFSHTYIEISTYEI